MAAKISVPVPWPHILESARLRKNYHPIFFFFWQLPFFGGLLTQVTGRQSVKLEEIWNILHLLADWPHTLQKFENTRRDRSRTFTVFVMANFSLFRVIKWMKLIYYLSPFVLSWVIWWGFGTVGEFSLVEAHRVNTCFNNSTNTIAPLSDPWLYKSTRFKRCLFKIQFAPVLKIFLRLSFGSRFIPSSFTLKE